MTSDDGMGRSLSTMRLETRPTAQHAQGKDLADLMVVRLPE
ncbi:hypothetical protein ENKNEFLB_00443 [Nocardioides aquaticus]|uniref:Uncharacterized protein n=1 Tax=Nocardioides aquaticus TaxID=160826 RepID=A0ABX8ECW8_9ACTN|nr:hypothetical protein ENKNEFLB_00443 [Nocardioides aquaticus]